MHDLVILHGALGASKEFEKVKEILSDMIQVHVLDFNGHGVNPRISNFTIDGFVQDLQSYIEKKNLIRPSVFGYSMGGYVALYHEGLRPGSFSRILTLGTKFNWTVDTSLREAGFLEPDTILDKVPNYANYLNSLHPDRWEENMQYTRDLMLSLGRNPVLSDDLIGSITIPVTIARGTLDKMVSREESERITDLSRNGTYIELNDVKHPIHQIDPARVSEYILSCFSNVL
jgi:pimeloyl-ACP methyl ester carboxylesterase